MSWNCIAVRNGNSGLSIDAPWATGMDGSDSKTADMTDPCRDINASRRRDAADRQGPPGRHANDTPGIFSPTSLVERQKVGKRLFWSLPGALAVLGLLFLLGPDAEDVERKFTVYGKEGPLRIMPEIAVDDGRDEIEQQLQPRAASPPGAPEYEILPEDPPPRESETPISDTEQNEEAEIPEDAVWAASGRSDRLADLMMPSQHADSDFIIRKLVRPLYPPDASAEDQQRPLLVVEGAFFLDEKADIVAVLIQSNEGGPPFAQAVRSAMELWEFEPRWRDGKPPSPRWLLVTWRFRSPLRSMPGKP
jgi:hypothetical protein